MENKTYRSNSREVMEKIRSHINDFYDLQDLIGDIEAVKLPYDSVYSAAIKLVEGGCFLIYYENIRKFLEKLNLNNKSGKTFSDFECWEMYKHLIAREVNNIIKKGGF